MDVHRMGPAALAAQRPDLLGAALDLGGRLAFVELLVVDRPHVVQAPEVPAPLGPRLLEVDRRQCAQYCRQVD
jgi:hypothetical protein